MHRHFNNCLFLFVLLTAAFPAAAQVQVCITEKQNQELLRRIDRKTERFHKSLIASLARPPLVSTETALEVTRYAEELTLLVGELTDFRAARSNVKEILRTASKIERWLLREEVRSQVVVDWAQLHAELQILAEAYRLKWTDAVVHQELFAELEKDVAKLDENLERTFAQPVSYTTLDDLRTALRDLRSATHNLSNQFEDNPRFSNLVDALVTQSDAIAAKVKGYTLNPQVQSDWRRVSSQLTELARLNQLDRQLSQMCADSR